MKIKRRYFIVFLIISGLIIVVNILVYFSDFEKLVRKIIVSDTSKLKIDASVYEEFIQDARKYNLFNRYFPGLQQKLIIFHFCYGSFFPFIPYQQSYKVYRARIVGLFLLSTDYFSNKMNAEKEIQYKYLYDPYRNVCSNPFSSLNYQ